MRIPVLLFKDTIPTLLFLSESHKSIILSKPPNTQSIEVKATFVVTLSIEGSNVIVRIVDEIEVLCFKTHRTQSVCAFLEALTDSIRSEALQISEKTIPRLPPLDPIKASPNPNPFIRNTHLITENIQLLKTAYLSKILRERSPSFTSFKPLRIQATTWNVAGTEPTEGMDFLWLDKTVDVVVVGFQEVDLSKFSYIIYDGTIEAAWSSAVLRRLGDDFIKISSKQLVGMLMYVFVRKGVEVTEVAAASIGSGVLGFMGNKGAVAIRLRINDSFFTFVNCHLAADVDQLERRNQDYSDISKRLAFEVDPKYVDAQAYYRSHPWVSDILDFSASLTNRIRSTGLLFAPSVNPKYLSLHLIWMGDLNYRVGVDESIAKTLIEDSKLQKLLELDQLNIERSSKRTFGGFEEKLVTFYPTYKFDIGTSTYDTRCPSFCDRVLWLKNPLSPDNLECTSYTSSTDTMTSDHKPVSSIFIAQARTVDHEKHQTVNRSAMRDLDVFENEATPLVKVEGDTISFDEVDILKICERKVTFVVAQFKLVPKNEDVLCTKPWYSVVPEAGSINPGEKNEIIIKIHVKPEYAMALNHGKATLDDILLFHVSHGKDLFVSLAGSWSQTCFGESISTLCRLVKPITFYTDVEIKELESSSPRELEEMLEDSTFLEIPKSVAKAAGDSLSFPKELWVLLDFLHRYGLEVDGLFLNKGDHSVCEHIRSCISSGVDIDTETLFADMCHFGDETAAVKISVPEYMSLPISSGPTTSYLSRGKAVAVHSVCEVLLLFISSFQEPIIPVIMQERCIMEGYLTHTAAKQIIRHLPLSSHNTFVYLISFLKLLCDEYKGKGAVNALSLAAIFAPLILKSPDPTLLAKKALAVEQSSYLSYFTTQKVVQVSPESVPLDADQRTRRKAARVGRRSSPNGNNIAMLKINLQKLPMPVIAFLALVAIQTGIGLIYKFASMAKGKSGYEFSQASALAISELFKFGLSTFFYYKSQGVAKIWTAEVPEKIRNGMILLSFLYLLNNHVFFYLVTLADPGTINLVKSSSTFLSACILWAFANRIPTQLQWFAIMFQLLGLITSQYDESSGAASSSIIIYALIFVNTIISAFCGCYNDYLTKASSSSLHALNMWLYSFGFAMNLVYYLFLSIFNPDEPSFFEGYFGWGFLVIVCNSVIGLAITAVYKYGDAVIKCLAQSTSTAILILLSFCFFGTSIRPLTAVGCAIIFLATYLYMIPIQQAPIDVKPYLPITKDEVLTTELVTEEE